MSKTCLILEGGGFKIAFTAGVLDVFLTAKYNPFDTYIGISGGTIAASYFLSGQFRFILHAMQFLASDTNFLNYRRAFANEGYMDIDYIKKVAEKEVPFLFDKALKAIEDKELYFVATKREHGTPEYFRPTNSKNWLDYSIASSTLPFVTKGRHKINGKSYFDGGWSDPLPVKWAYKNGAKKIVIIRTFPLDYREVQSWADYFGSYYYGTGGLKKAFDESYKYYNEAIDFMNNPPKDLVIEQISPVEILKSATYSYTKDTINQDYRHGVEMGMLFVHRKLNKSKDV